MQRALHWRTREFYEHFTSILRTHFDYMSPVLHSPVSQTPPLDVFFVDSAAIPKLVKRLICSRYMDKLLVEGNSSTALRVRLV